MKKHGWLWTMAMVAALGFTCNVAQAGRWISQSKWIGLAPINNGAGCGVLTETDMLTQFAGIKAAFLDVDPTPMVGDAWVGLTYREGSGKWDNYGCRGDGDLIDFNAFYGQNDFVVGVVITYAFNNTVADLPVTVCFSSDDAGLVAVNDDVALVIDACRGSSENCDPPGLMPAVLKPGMNRILAAAWEEGGGWNLRCGLQRADGSQIDDDTAADVSFFNRPDGTQDRFCGAARSIGNVCPPDGSETVSLKGAGTPPNPADTFAVSETVRGNVTVSDITGGGVFVPAGQTVNDAALCGAGNPQGLLEDSIDLGAIAPGSTVFDAGTGVYTINGAGGDIHGGSDRAHFAYKRITGDFDMRIKIDSVSVNDGDDPAGYPAESTTADRWGRYGLMAREDCDQNSRQVMCNQPTKDARGNKNAADDVQLEFAGHLRRATKGGGTDTGQGNDYYTNEGDNHIPFNGQTPAYQRLTRVGNNFCTYTSQNGTDWVFQVCDDWGNGAPSTVRVGPVVSSHLDAVLLQVKFSGLSITTSAASTRGGTITWPAKTFDMVDYSYKVSGLGRAFMSGKLTNATTDLGLGGRNGVFVQAAKTADIGQFQYARDLGPNRDNFIDNGGSTTYDAATQTYTQVGTGNDLWWQGDTGQWAWREVEGDFDVAIEITNRVEPTGGDRHGRFGLMSRRDCNDFSSYVLLAEHSTGTVANRVPMLTQIRPAAFHLGSFDGNTDDGLMRANTPPDDKPNFQRMVRLGNTVYTFFSRDGVDWHAHGAEPMVLQGGPSIPLDVGVVLGAHGSHRGRRPERSFKILQFNEALGGLPVPVHDDGIDAGEELYSNPFDDAADLVFNKRESFLPLVIDGELKLLAENDGDDATTALVQAHTLDAIDSGDKYAFDFDIRFQGGGGNPADGAVFVIMGGTDFTRVGGGGGGMGYFALNRSIPGDNSIDTPSVGVEFDNWQGGGYNEGWGSTTTGEAGEWHTGIIPTGTLTAEIQTSGTPENPLPNIYDPAGIHARVTYSAGNVEVWLGQNTAEGPATSLTKWVETRVLPLTYAQEEGFTCIYGFAGGTGGATVSCFIDNLSVKLIECNDIVEVASIAGAPLDPVTPGTVVTLDGSGSSAGAGDTGAITYKWTAAGAGAIEGSDTGATVAIKATGAGDVNVSLVVNDGACNNPATANATFKVKAAQNWVRCDVNGDNGRDLTDAVFSLNFQFLAGPPSPCPGSLDCNKDGNVDLTDAVFDLNFQFLAGPPPAAPYPGCDLFEGAGCSGHAACP